MEAKDTAISTDEANRAYDNARKTYEDECKSEGKPIDQIKADEAGINGQSLVQAKISFEAGREAATREMHSHINEMLAPIRLCLYRIVPTSGSNDYGLADKDGDAIDIESVLKPAMDSYYKD